MANKHTETNMQNVPANYGFMEDGVKKYGHTDSTGEECVKMVDRDQRHSHTWQRHGYCVYQMRKDETDEEGWTIVGKRRKLLESRKMCPCPYELSEEGECPMRFDPEHEKWHYHFAKRREGKVVRNGDGKPVCRYHLNGRRKCWEKHHSMHRQVFDHR